MTMNAQQARGGLIIFIVGAAFGSLLRPPAAGAAAPAEACALLTQAEVAAALGVSVDPGERLMPNETRFCTWREHGKDKLQARNVQVNLITQRQYEIGKTPIPSMIKTPESRIGDDAYFSKAKGMVFNLSVKKGDAYFRIMARSNADALVTGNSAALDEKDKEIDRAIARAILKKL